MELKIDGQICDLKAGSIAVPGYDAARLADPEACREGRSLKIPIPATPRNDALVGFACDPHAAGGFNDALHTAELSAEGSALIGGTVRLLAASGEGYTLEIRDGGAGWAENAARRMFSRLGVAWDNVLTPTAIVESWTDDSPVKFFPIHRDEYRRQNSSSDLLPAERLLSVEDYHPFLHVATLVGQIFREADYEVKSRFFESAFFRSLYMSGAYSSRDTTAAAGRMGFSARRLAPATAAANELGRVSANPKAVANTVGNIVDTATPQSVDADGEAIDGLFNNGNCFSTDNGKIVFTPPTEISVGFEYRLKYTTAHRIVSRTRLKGFDTVYLGPGAEFRFELANRYRDLREAVAPNFTYRALVFDHLAGAQYRLTYTRNGVPGTVWTDFAARSAQVTTPASGTVVDPVLLVRSGSQWVAPEIHEVRTWRYRDGDGAVARFDAGEEAPLGAWSFAADSYAAMQGEKVLRNPLFSPSLNAAGHYLNAPSALIPEVGDRDDAEEDGTNFTLRIVRYAGMHPLPGDERWGYPSGRSEYPLAAFHFAGDDAAEGFTLCFEDRDGQQGLHRFYDGQVRREASRERIILSLRLAPHEFEALLTPGTGAPDIRSVFRIDTGAGVVRAALHAVGDYDPAKASVRCTFNRLMED